MKYYTSKDNPLPKRGEVIKDDYGGIICHICGKAYNKLGCHVRQAHKMTAEEYKKEFGLCTTRGLISDKSKEKARQRNLENFDKVVADNLIKKGVDTRYKKGDKGRTKDKVCIQLVNELRERLPKGKPFKKGENQHTRKGGSFM